MDKGSKRYRLLALCSWLLLWLTLSSCLNSGFYHGSESTDSLPPAGGVIQVSSGLRFQLLYPEAKAVSLVGSFNNWDPTAHLLLENSPGFWSITLSLPEGRYQYQFVIDQTLWMPDPWAEEPIDDGFGQKNSLLIVE